MVNRGTKERSRSLQWVSRNRRQQVFIAGGLGLVVGIGLALLTNWGVASLIGWDVAGLYFLFRTWSALWPLDPAGVSKVATREDPGRGSADLMLILASVVCIAGIGFVLMRAANSKGLAVAELLAVAIASLLTSWLVVHTVFTLRYAHLFYDGEEEGSTSTKKTTSSPSTATSRTWPSRSA